MLIDSILEAVGNTPLLRVKRLASGNVFAKAEFLNPGGSIKDRVAKHLIESGEKEGNLRLGMIIIESTLGNMLMERNKRKHLMKKGGAHKGFTFTELMIVIAIIGILAGIAIQRLSAYRDKSYTAAIISDGKSAYTATVGYFLDNPCSV
jgi:prepilin-type N-terminal cleavage/methylation domain-containing protein